MSGDRAMTTKQFVPQRVIVGKQLQPLPTVSVHAGIAHVGDHDPIVRQQHAGERGAHLPVPRPSRFRPYFRVRRREAPQEKLLAGRLVTRLLGRVAPRFKGTLQGLDKDARRHLTPGHSPDPIGHGKKTALGNGDEGVFIPLTSAPDVGEPEYTTRTGNGS